MPPIGAAPEFGGIGKMKESPRIATANKNVETIGIAESLQNQHAVFTPPMGRKGEGRRKGERENEGRGVESEKMGCKGRGQEKEWRERSKWKAGEWR